MDEKALFDRGAMYHGKADWVAQISQLLITDPDNGVLSCQYFHKAGVYGEYVIIRYKGDGSEWINVSLNSLGAILLEITDEVYGNGAQGHVYDTTQIQRLNKKFLGVEE